MDDYHIQEVDIKELDETLSLVKRVFDEFEAPCYSSEGIQSFYEFTNYDIIKYKLTQNMKMLVVKDNEKIIGMIAFRDYRHICMLFVDKKYHKKGIGRKLVNMAIDFCKSNDIKLEEITVNSSPYAIEFYHRMGFEDIDKERVEDGIKFTPMKINLI